MSFIFALKKVRCSKWNKYHKDLCIRCTFLPKFWAKNRGWGLYTRPLFSEAVNWLVRVTNSLKTFSWSLLLITACVWSVGSYRSRWFASSSSKPRRRSFKRFISTLLEKLNSNWHEVSISPHSCLQCCLWLITSKLIFFFTTCKKMPRYSGELAKQLADHFIALYYFHGIFVHGVV